jgi:hypothetical protein
MTETPTPEPTPGSPADDTLAYGFPAAPSPRRGRQGLLIGAGAAVLAVLAGVAVYATTALSGGGRQPDEVVPRATFAYLKVDLDPAANQKLAARSFFGKFPKLKSASDDTDSVFDGLLEQAFDGGGDISFATDVKPWFDRRAAVAAFPGSTGTAVVAVFRSKDDAKARAALDRVATKARIGAGDVPAYTIAKGYVLVSDKQASVDDAVRLSAQASLRDNATYRGDVARLAGDQVVTGWADVAQAFRAGTAALPFSGLEMGALAGLAKGRIVAGLHLTNDYVEVQGRTIGTGAKQLPKTGDPVLLKRLPASTVAAASFQDLAGTLKTGLAAAGGVGGANPLGLVDLFLGQSGISFEDDILPVLGSQTVLALGTRYLFADDVPAKFGLVATVDPALPSATREKVTAALAQAGFPVNAELSDGTLYVATPGYESELAKGGTLGSSAAFTKAMGDVGAVSFALYADIRAILGDGTGGEFAALRSFGMVSGVQNGEQFFRARLVAE